MNYRYSYNWATSNGISRAVAKLGMWGFTPPRGIWPGVSEPIPVPDTQGLFADIARAVAAEMWAQYPHIAVVWSGGVDSSLVAVALMESKPAGSVLSVVSEPATFASSGNVWPWLADRGCQQLWLSRQTLRDVVDQGGMVTTGYHADTLLCGDIIRYHNLYSSIWNMTVEEMFIHMDQLHPEDVLTQLKMIEPLLQQMPLERTAANVAFWLDYTCAWHGDEMALMKLFDVDAPGVGYVNFFAHPTLQAWSLRDVAEKVGKTHETHKSIYKALLSEIMGTAPIIQLNTEPGEGYLSTPEDRQIQAVRADWTPVY